MTMSPHELAMRALEGFGGLCTGSSGAEAVELERKNGTRRGTRLPTPALQTTYMSTQTSPDRFSRDFTASRAPFLLSSMNPWLGRLTVNFVLCLICFIAYSSQIFIIWPWYGRVLSVELITLLLPFK